MFATGASGILAWQVDLIPPAKATVLPARHFEAIYYRRLGSLIKQWPNPTLATNTKKAEPNGFGFFRYSYREQDCLRRV
jgi:hypothetical protein